MKTPDEIKRGLEYLSITNVAQKVEAAKKGLPYVYTAVSVHDMRAFGDYGNGETGSTLKARDYKDATDLIVGQNGRKYIVRRLTPLECCRLQGFPDWWEDGVEGSDSARYKMWGNGIALPCAVDVLRRIAKQFYGNENHHRFEDEIIQEAET